MKSKYAIALAISMITMGTFAQKDELKALEKALKSTDDQMIKTSLTNAEKVLANATDAEKAQFYFLKGNAMMLLSKRSPDKGEKLLQASKSYQEVVEIEKKIGKSKFTPQSQSSLVEVQNGLVHQAINDNNASRFSQGTLKLYEAYNINKKDTIYLYYAANGAVNGGDYDTALRYYDELKKMNFSGISIQYYATEKTTGEEVSFDSKTERDLFVKAGTHVKPRQEKTSSKRGEIYRNYALILVEKGEVEKAKIAIAEARKSNPNDASLAISEANLYLDEGDFENYKRVVSELLIKSPNDADLLYNLGVVSSKANNNIDAEMYYLKAIEIKNDYKNAYKNLAILRLEADTKIVDEMNKLGGSASDNKRYEVLRKEREKLFSTVIPILEKVIELDSKDVESKKTLLNLYSILDLTDKYKTLKSTMN
ncbi:tetratricopeptide repeat protein [Flavobacterium sp. UBA6135]|uniref:tetratricopeptide repeat protein n=1 Tax=Flavobacterium sp. UBA6135 TaxID=1946553 RepID=UPI0025B7FE3C|nr:tetratricopeptide repeat protein [Flavobacterium sp. UBA6135]